MIRCSNCSSELSEEEIKRANRIDLGFSTAHDLSCPRCGFKMPEPENLIKLLKKWSKRKSVPGR